MSRPRPRRPGREELPEEYFYHSRPDVLEAKHREIDEKLARLKACDEAAAAERNGGTGVAAHAPARFSEIEKGA